MPRDMDLGGSGLGNIVLYGLTGLLAHEAHQQLKQLDIYAGSAWGIREHTVAFEYALAMDQLLGGEYLRAIERDLGARRDQYGLRDRDIASASIDVSRLRNYGLVMPMPLDVMFNGRTLRTQVPAHH